MIYLSYLHICVQLKVASLISQGKVILGQFGFGCVKSHLVASQPAFIAQHRSSMDDGTLEVNVTAQVYIVMLVTRLQLATLFTVKIYIILALSLLWFDLYNM